MPTYVADADRKLTFRRRVRLSKQEMVALEGFFATLEKKMARGHRAADLKDNLDLAKLGIFYLGSGVFKTAFSLPGNRYVVKVPNGNLADLKAAAVEGEMYDKATPELRQHLATTRVSPKPYATLQEMAPATVGGAVKKAGFGTAEARTIEANYNAFIKMLRDQFGIRDRDLHQANVAIRSDGSLCVIDFALEKF